MQVQLIQFQLEGAVCLTCSPCDLARGLNDLVLHYEKYEKWSTCAVTDQCSRITLVQTALLMDRPIFPPLFVFSL